VAASNRAEDRAGAHRLITPLLNRFVHLELEVAPEDWQAWAVQAGLAPEVRAFLRCRPALLFQFDATAGARAFPTPRSWEFVAQVLPVTPPELLHPVVAGCVGEGPAAEFVAFCRVSRDLPNVDQVLVQPQSCPVPSDPAVLYALAGALSERCRRADERRLGAAVTYAGRMPEELAVLTVRDIAAVNPRVLTVPQAAGWLKAHRALLLPERR
jgi:hypothetical protein